MPSQNTENNMLYMDWVSMTTESEKSDSAASQNYFYNKSLHLYNNTKDYFPTLNLNSEFVPVGESKQVCINIAWVPLKEWRGSYGQVKSLPECAGTLNLKSRWQRNDPKNGVDIQIWKQQIEDISCSTTITCKLACPGVYKAGPDDSIGKCYTYDVLKSICLEIGLVLNQETAEEQWEYRGGCFEHDSPTLFERAVPGNTYEFDFIPIEVRADDDPFNVAAKTGSITSMGKSGTDLTFFGWLSWISFSLSLIGSFVLVVSIGARKVITG